MAISLCSDIRRFFKKIIIDIFSDVYMISSNDVC